MVMSKITEQELQNITDAVALEQSLVQQLGTVEFQIQQLKDTKEQLIDNMSKQLKERQESLNELSDKYSIETLNVNTGEYTVTK
jgi:hypothetical protein|tara:strand:- start:4 stop:255 length:252 start_codon:yes stop_codon:yes gene_type:complete